MLSRHKCMITAALIHHSQCLPDMTDWLLINGRLHLLLGWQCLPGVERCWWVGHDLVQARVGLVSTCKWYESDLSQCVTCATHSISIHKMHKKPVHENVKCVA